MKPLIVLIVVFALSWIFRPPALAGNIAMFAMLCFTSLGHFKFTAGMTRMISAPIPYKRALVYVTGILEPALGLALLFPSTRTVAAAALIALFVLLLPANISAALCHLNYETGEPNGPGPRYLWFRVPLQLLFIAWIVYFGLR